LEAKDCILYSGGAPGAEAEFGRLADEYGLQEVNYTFPGHKIERSRGLRVLTRQELALKDVSVKYISKIMGRRYSESPLLRKLLQSLCWQVSSGREVFVVGVIQDDGTVKGGTGWGAEYAKIRNKPLYVFDQEQERWLFWSGGEWTPRDEPVIGHNRFTGTGTRNLTPAGKSAVEQLFARTFGDA
jgi:hypothetical protein